MNCEISRKSKDQPDNGGYLIIKHKICEKLHYHKRSSIIGIRVVKFCLIFQILFRTIFNEIEF